jgi:hypothetical protein
LVEREEISRGIAAGHTIRAIRPCGSPTARIICQHSHSKEAKNLPSDAPDLASTDDTDSLAVQVEAYKSIKGKVQLAHAIECAMGLAVQRQQQGNSMFSKASCRRQRR